MSRTRLLLAAAAVGFTVAGTAVSNAQSAPPQVTPAIVVPKTGVYQIDPTHTQVRMTWNHVGLSNPGATFENVQGVITIDPAHPERSRVSVRIAAASVDTGVPQLDADFLTDKFFDVARYPNITFESRSVSFTGIGRSFTVTGDLSVRDITQPVVLHAVLNGAGLHPNVQAPAIGFAASTRFKRSDFGLNVALPMVSDEIDVQITVEAIAANARAQ